MRKLPLLLFWSLRKNHTNVSEFNLLLPQIRTKILDISSPEFVSVKCASLQQAIEA